MTKTELLTGKPFLHVTSTPDNQEHFIYHPATAEQEKAYIGEHTNTCTTCYTVLYVTHAYIVLRIYILNQLVVVQLPLSEYVLINP